MNWFPKMKKEPEGAWIQGSLPAVSVPQKGMWLKLRSPRSCTSSCLCNSSLPESILPGVCHAASSLCWVNISQAALGLFAQSFSQCLSLSGQTSPCYCTEHTELSTSLTVAQNLASPPHYLSQREEAVLSSSLLWVYN